MKTFLTFLLMIAAIGFVFGYIDLEPYTYEIDDTVAFETTANIIGEQFIESTSKVAEKIESVSDTLLKIVTGPKNLIDKIKSLFTGSYDWNATGPFGGGGGRVW